MRVRGISNARVKSPATNFGWTTQRSPTLHLPQLRVAFGSHKKCVGRCCARSWNAQIASASPRNQKRDKATQSSAIHRKPLLGWSVDFVSQCWESTPDPLHIPQAAFRQRHLLAGTACSALRRQPTSNAAAPATRMAQRGRWRRLQISVCSEISRASSTSMPRYLTVDSSLECPRSSWTARRFLVRR